MQDNIFIEEEERQHNMYAIQGEGLDEHFLLLAASSNFLNIFQILLLVDASSPYNGWILYSAGPVE